MPRKWQVSSRRFSNPIWRAFVLAGVIALALLEIACFPLTPVSYFVIFPGPFPGSPAPAGGLTTPSSVTMNVGDTLQLRLIEVIPPPGVVPSSPFQIPAGSHLIDLTGQTSWNANIPSVANVDARGLVTALAAGSTDVDASTPIQLISIKIIVPNPNADVSVSSASSIPATVQDGDTATVTTTVNNAGPAPATATVVRVTTSSPVTVTNLPASWTQINPTTYDFNLGTLAPGASATVTLPMLLGTGNIPSVTSTFTVSTSANDPNPGNNSSSGTTAVVQRLTLSASGLACAVGAPCNAAATASGGTPPYRFSATGLPGWATMTLAGVITGTPLDGTGGNPLINVLVQDSTVPPFSDSKSERMDVLEIQGTTTLVNGIEGRAYSDTRPVVGDSGICVASVISGALPPGIFLSARQLPNSAILPVGTPTQAGSYTFTAQFVCVSVAVSKTFTVNIAPPPAPLVLNAGSLNCAVGAACNHVLRATGGTPPYNFAAPGLPSWATLNPATGAITGTPPDGSGSVFSVQVSVTDSDNPAQTANGTLPAHVLEILGTSPLPSGFVGRNYGLVAPVALFGAVTTSSSGVYSVVAGALPPGLSLAQVANTPPDATLLGSPAQVGTFTFTLQFAEGTNAAAKQFTVTINAGLIVVPNSASPKQGDPPLQLQAFALLDLAGTQTDVTGLVAWSSDLPLIADVSDVVGTKGQVSALQPSPPVVLITATAQTGASATAQITVDRRLADASVSCPTPSGTPLTSAPHNTTCMVGNGGTDDLPALNVSIVLSGAAGTLNTLSSPGGPCTLTSQTTGQCTLAVPNGASVPLDVEMTATTPGLSTITVELTGNFTDPNTTDNIATVGTTFRQTQSIAVTPSNSSVQVGLDVQFIATATFTDSTTQDFTTLFALTWSSSDTSIATIKNGVFVFPGRATGVAPGTVTITATLASVGISGSTTLTVTGPPTALAITTTEVLCGVGTQCNQAITVTGGTPPYSCSATGLPPWGSLDSQTCTFAGAAQAGDGATTPVTVTVQDSSNPPLTTMGTVSVKGVEILAPSPLPDGFVGTPYFSTMTGVNAGLLLGSDAPSWLALGAPVSNNLPDGSFEVVYTLVGTPQQAGTFTFTVSAAGGLTSGQFTITIHPGLRVEPAAGQVPEGLTLQFLAFAISDVSIPAGVDVTATVTWSSEDVSIATVSNAPGSEGQATGVMARVTPVKITATAMSGASASADLIVVRSSISACANVSTFAPAGGIFSTPLDPVTGVINPTFVTFPSQPSLVFANGGAPGADTLFTAGGGTSGATTNVMALQQDPQQGCATTQLASITLAGGGSSIAAFGNLVFVGYSSAGGGIRVLLFDPVANTFFLVAGSPFSTGGLRVTRIAVNAAGTHLIALVGSAFRVFAIDPTTGVLTLTQDLSLSTAFGLSPIRVSFNPAGNRVYLLTLSPAQVATAPFDPATGMANTSLVTTLPAPSGLFSVDMTVDTLSGGSDVVVTVLAPANPTLRVLRSNTFNLQTSLFFDAPNSPQTIDSIQTLFLDLQQVPFVLYLFSGGIETRAVDPATGGLGTVPASTVVSPTSGARVHIYILR